MAWYDTLLQQGYTPEGVQRKVITEPGGKPEWQPDKLSQILRGVEKYQQTVAERQAKEKKLMDDQLDMYKSLRESGYTSEKAFQAVQKRRIPSEVPGQTTEEKKAEAEIGLKEAQASYYDEGGSRTIKKDKLEDLIKEKIANGDELTPGEMKIWEDVIKKKGGTSTGASDLDGVLVDKNKTTPVEDLSKPTLPGKFKGMVAVIDPDGNRGYIPEGKLAAALKKGYKRR